MKTKEFNIWSEGYRANGESSGAVYLGIYAGVDFRDACLKWANSTSDRLQLYDRVRNTYWGCQLFDNEIDARANFG